MADVFLSYAREDQSWARLLASVLESRGWSVWWDRRIPHGKKFATYIEQQLADARCIVVLWSKQSIASTFVHDEASEGLNDGRLVPVLIETVRQPIGFRQFHAADLSDWREGQPHEELDRLIDSIRAVVPPSAVPTTPPIAAAPATSTPVEPGRRAQAAEPAPDLRNARIVSWNPFEADPELRRVGPDLHKVSRQAPAVASRRASRVALGIDLGSTNAVAAVSRDGRVVLIETEKGTVHMPAVVAFTKSDGQLVGLRAKRQAVTNRENTIVSIRQFMGRAFKDVEEQVKGVRYRVVPGPDGDACVSVNGTTYSPPEIAAAILRKLKQAAEAHAGQPIAEAVITIPAYFSEAQRRATERAGQLAGFEMIHLLEDPVAAALGYHFEKNSDSRVAVYDFGGATFSATIVEARDENIGILASHRSLRLGGDDLDRQLLDYIVDAFRNSDDIDLSRDVMALQRLTEAAETAKIELSSVQATEINLPYITADQQGPRHLRVKLTRTKFELLIENLVKKTVDTVRYVLSGQAVGLKKLHVDDVLLAGGSTAIPLVQTLVRELFGKEPRGVNPADAAAVGAARHAAMLQESRSQQF